MEKTIDLLLDTNILIAISHGDRRCARFLEGKGTLGISVISEMELLIGARNEHEEAALTALLFGIEILPLAHEIAFEAVRSLRSRKQKNLRSQHFADTTIAQTALLYGAPLVTNNVKDFSIFDKLEIMSP